eukprot:1792256-Prymnesium_polylepis.1
MEPCSWSPRTSELLGAEHGLDEREDALAGRGASWQDGEGEARRVGPVGDLALALVELPPDEHISGEFLDVRVVEAGARGGGGEIERQLGDQARDE